MPSSRSIAGHLFDDLLESLGAEAAVFLLFELVAQFVELLGRQNLSQGGKEHGVFAGRVGAIHADERLAGRHQPATWA